MVVATRRDTKSAIMDSAELLMAEHGINGVSLREILRQANANPAALNYHFNSKEGLIHSILDRRGHDVRVRRLELLRALEGSEGAPTVAGLIDAIVDPLVEFLYQEGEAGRRFLRFIARLHSDRTGIIYRMEREEFPEMVSSITRVLSATSPHLSNRDQRLRMAMVMDVMYQSLGNADVMSEDWLNDDHHPHLDAHISALKRFLCGGLSAP